MPKKEDPDIVQLERMKNELPINAEQEKRQALDSAIFALNEWNQYVEEDARRAKHLHLRKKLKSATNGIRELEKAVLNEEVAQRLDIVEDLVTIEEKLVEVFEQWFPDDETKEEREEKHE